MKQFKNILYVFEPSIPQETNIARAISLAQNNQAHLTIIDVIPEQAVSIGVSAELTEALISERWKMLASLISSDVALPNIDIEVLVGTKFLEVIRAVLRNHYDLVMKPTENPDWVGRLFGSDDMHLLRKCPCPVWLMKQQEKADYGCIVAAVDFNPDDLNGSQLNHQILELAGSLALSGFSELHIVHAWDVVGTELVRDWAEKPEVSMIAVESVRQQAGMDTLVRIFREQLGSDAYTYLSPQIHLPKGAAREVIPDLIKSVKADLVIMGTVVRTGIPGFIIGNTAEAILDQLTCSVLAIKPPGFVTPVTPS